jgi:hypothetical protein
MEIERPFSCEFELEIRERLLPRIEFARAVRYPGALPVDPQQEVTAGQIVAVSPSQGPPWLALFELDRFGPPSFGPRILTWPDRASFCVVDGSGWVVRADDPASAFELPIYPICSLQAVPEVGYVLVGSFCDLVAYGRAGPVWGPTRVVLDSLQIVGMRDGTLTVSGFDGSLESPGSDITLEVDLASGQLVPPATRHRRRWRLR